MNIVLPTSASPWRRSRLREQLLGRNPIVTENTVFARKIKHILSTLGTILYGDLTPRAITVIDLVVFRDDKF